MNGDEVLIRREQPDDQGGIRVVNEAAFGRSDEADLSEHSMFYAPQASRLGLDL
jgi:predicted N-acetyltransferase YhbS